MRTSDQQVNSHCSHVSTKGPNDLNSIGVTQLMAAAYKNCEEEVRNILKDPELRLQIFNRNKKETALTYAAGKGHTKIVELFLADPRCDPNFFSERRGWSPLMRGSIRGHVGVVKALLKHPDIDVDIVDVNGWTALDLATKEGRTEVVKCLLEAMSEKSLDDRMLRLLHIAQDNLEDGHEVISLIFKSNIEALGLNAQIDYNILNQNLDKDASLPGRNKTIPSPLNTMFELNKDIKNPNLRLGKIDDSDLNLKVTPVLVLGAMVGGFIAKKLRPNNEKSK